MLSLLSGVNVLCYEKIKNDNLPLTVEYKNEIVFSDWYDLVKQIHKMLNKEISCGEIVSEEFLEKYDLYRDENSLKRIGQYLYEQL